MGVFHGPERRLREEISNPAGRGSSRPEVPGLAGVGPALPLAFPPIVPAPLPGILPDGGLGGRDAGEGGAPAALCAQTRRALAAASRVRNRGPAGKLAVCTARSAIPPLPCRPCLPPPQAEASELPGIAAGNLGAKSVNQQIMQEAANKKIVYMGF